MRYLILVGLLALAIAFDLAVFVAASDESLGAFDPYRPATLLPIMTSRLHALQAQVRELDVRDFFDSLAAPYHRRIGHENPTPLVAR